MNIKSEDAYGIRIKPSPTVIISEQLKPPKFTFIDWRCPNCNFKNMVKIMLKGLKYALECDNCGAEYRIEVSWSHSSTGSASK